MDLVRSTRPNSRPPFLRVELSDKRPERCSLKSDRVVHQAGKMFSRSSMPMLLVPFPGMRSSPSSSKLRRSTTSKSPRKTRRPSKLLSSKSMLTDPVILTRPNSRLPSLPWKVLPPSRNICESYTLKNVSSWSYYSYK